jgi:hypothetical protein
VGNVAMGTYAATRLPRLMQAAPDLAAGANDPTTKVANGLFLASAGGLGTSWTKYGGGTPTITAVSAGYGLGNWQDIGADAGGTQIEQYVTTVIGNVYELTFRLKKDSVPGFRMRVAAVDWHGDYKAVGTAITEAQGAIVTQRFTATGTATQLLFGAKGASGSCSIAQVTVRDITALAAT